MTIKDLRLEKGMTLANFAKAIGIGMSTLTSYEAGKRKPGEKAVAAIKEVFGVDLNEAAAAVENAVETAVKTVEAAVAPVAKEAAPAEPAPDAPAATVEPAAAAVPAPAPVKEKKAAAKKPAAKKEAKAPAKKAAPAMKEAKAPAKKEAKAPAKKKTASAPAAKVEKKVEIIIQSPMGGEITPEEIMSRIGDVDKVYIRIDQNAAYWVKGDESGAINLW